MLINYEILIRFRMKSLIKRRKKYYNENWGNLITINCIFDGRLICSSNLWIHNLKYLVDTSNIGGR